MVPPPPCQAVRGSAGSRRRLPRLSRALSAFASPVGVFGPAIPGQPHHTPCRRPRTSGFAIGGPTVVCVGATHYCCLPAQLPDPLVSLDRLPDSMGAFPRPAWPTKGRLHPVTAHAWRMRRPPVNLICPRTGDAIAPSVPGFGPDVPGRHACARVRVRASVFSFCACLPGRHPLWPTRRQGKRGGLCGRTRPPRWLGGLRRALWCQGRVWPKRVVPLANAAWGRDCLLTPPSRRQTVCYHVLPLVQTSAPPMIIRAPRQAAPAGSLWGDLLGRSEDCGGLFQSRDRCWLIDLSQTHRRLGRAPLPALAFCSRAARCCLSCRRRLVAMCCLLGISWPCRLVRSV